MTITLQSLLRIAGVLAVVACGTRSDDRSIPSAESVLPPDSAINPIVVRVTDAVAASDVHSVQEEMRIAPGVNDASTFTRIHEFVVDKTGSSWVYDNPSNTICVFDSTGKFVRRVGRDGKGPGEFRFNGGMVALADGRVALMDDANSRVSFFSPPGEYETSWHFPIGSVRVRALVQDASGQLYVKRTIFPESGRILELKGREALIQVRDGGSGDTLYSPDLRIPESLYELGSEDAGDDMRMTSTTEAKYTPKMLWDWHPSGYFVTGHGALYEITLFRTSERPIRIERTFAPVPVSTAERQDEERMILGSATRKWRGPPLPDRKPALMDLFIARDGRIWARVPAPSTTTIISNPAKPPVTTYQTPVVWEVFSAEGAFLGRVAFPGRARVMDAEGDRVWAIQLDDDDLQAVVRYRIVAGLKGQER